MKNITHDPLEYIRGIQQILISDKKRIGFLFGAGTSLAKKTERSLTIPAIGIMTAEIVRVLGNKKEKFEKAFDEIRKELGVKSFNVETILSNLEQKVNFIGGGTLNGLKKDEFSELILEIKREIRKMVSIHKHDTDKTVEIAPELVQSDFANWIGKVERKHAIEIFTTNYDFLFELGLEHHEIPYYDGFTGSLKPFFNAESIEDFTFLASQTKLWKIHGSLGWRHDKDIDRIVRVESCDDDILIYPSTLKYKDSKKQPYESLLDRLSNFLKKDDSILITCGYSWGDEHINSRIISALKSNTSSHVIGLIYDKYWDNDSSICYSLNRECSLASIAKRNSKISIYGNRSAIIGCNYGEWKLRTKPSEEDIAEISSFFDIEADEKSNSIDKEQHDSETWTGNGEFILTDFSKLVSFLNRMISENEIKKHGVKK